MKKKLLFPDKCEIHQGYIPESTEGIHDEFCFVSLDMDLYKPIIEGLRYFYPRLVSGGYIMVHDCCNDYYKGPRKAINEFCKEAGVGYVIGSDEYGTAIFTKR